MVHGLTVEQFTNIVSKSYQLQIKSIKTQIRMLKEEYKEKIAPQLSQVYREQAQVVKHVMQGVVDQAKIHTRSRELVREATLHRGHNLINHGERQIKFSSGF